MAADEAEAVLVDAAGAVAGREEVQLVDHMVVAAYEGLIDPGSLQDRQFEGSFQEPPAVTVAHRLLKNTVRDRIGARPYLFMTDAAASGLALQGIGLAHGEEYPDAGQIKGRLVELGG